MNTQEIDEFNEDLIDEEYQDPDNIEDEEFLIKLDDKYSLRRDKFQFKLGYYKDYIDKDGTTVTKWNTYGYYPVFVSAMAGYIELCSKAKAKTPKELVEDYTSKYQEFKKYTTELSELVEKLYKEIMEKDDIIRRQTSKLNKIVNKVKG
jgi:hypothetical protein